ncbi:MAG: flagellar protein FlaG [Gammaproteobacteria bacterium]|nr:flagellar protein FlaG [Gammaproteobacteria bacterium]
MINALSETADKLNRIAHSVQRNLSFTVDEPTGRTVIRVMDTSTGETVRQIPTEEALALAQHLDSIIEVDRNGLLFRSDV